MTLAVCAGACTVSPVRAWAQQDAGGDRKSYADKIRATYNFRFGADKPSMPGNAAMEGRDFIQPHAFLTAEYCGRCHQEAYSQWRQAVHSNSFRTPFYRASVNILLRTKGIEFARHCDSCHNPIAVLSGALTENSQVDRGFDQDGVTCTTCHSIQQIPATDGNGGFVMGVPAVAVDADGNRIPGIVPDEEIRKHPDRHSRAVMQSFYRTPEFCSACHKANLPASLNGYKFIRAFTAYDEWQYSKFSQRNPLTFYTAGFTTCQDCHMQRSPLKLKDEGAKHGTLASHRWPAGNTAVPFYYGFDEQLQNTIEFLKSGMYLNVDLFGIRKAGDSAMAAPLGSTAFHLAPGDVVQMMVVIQNKNIGHSLVPEVRDLYEPWVEFAVRDSTGKDIYHSGYLNPDGTRDQRSHSFTNKPVNMDGDFVDNHKVWTIHSVAYDNTIQAGRSTLVRYEFHIPDDVKGPLSVTARVNYRHLRQSYLNNVLGDDHPAYPIVELASRTRTLNIGDNPAAGPDPKDNPDWMRWNNIGIAYLDQLQYADAMHAFEQVVKLRPDYADGHINIGLTYIEWEKYSAARPDLEQALALSPNNPRALYYMALVERREGHYDEEVADLQRVVTQYPQARDPRRELGIAYYQRHGYQEAIEQFEALQKIDPDDLAAHYNLAVLYRRVGMKEKAAEQAALFATKQVDPGAPTYSLEYLRKHPEISTESVPWHMHTDIVPAPVASGGQF
ncbi:MAG TPA: tetratricopeptide repeat protein [Bryobacteraceae bacterium]|nr:tetratricopeptide repeat protein [Bryobacteraceae bacterium]